MYQSLPIRPLRKTQFWSPVGLQYLHRHQCRPKIWRCCPYMRRLSLSQPSPFGPFPPLRLLLPVFGQRLPYTTCERHVLELLRTPHSHAGTKVQNRLLHHAVVLQGGQAGAVQSSPSRLHLIVNVPSANTQAHLVSISG